ITAEAALWAKLRNRQLGGLKFVRQAPIGPYFVDFLCRERKVIVEVDGETHGTEQQIHDDAIRSEALRAMGYRVFRVSNSDIYERLEYVLDHLLAFTAVADR